MNKPTVLIVDDEEDIAELIAFNLEKEGFSTHVAHSGEEGLALCRTKNPDMVILDQMLPGISGIEVLKRIRSDRQTPNIPVIMLTARSEEADIVVGLELGADDYITKPFSPRVLLARLRAVLRRGTETPDEGEETITAGEIRLFPERMQATIEGAELSLTRMEFEILRLLTAKPGWVFSREQILEATRGEDVTVTDRAVDVQIVSLRRKLGNSGKRIETVRGVGYRFRN